MIYDLIKKTSLSLSPARQVRMVAKMKNSSGQSIYRMGVFGVGTRLVDAVTYLEFQGYKVCKLDIRK